MDSPSKRDAIKEMCKRFESSTVQNAKSSSNGDEGLKLKNENIRGTNTLTPLKDSTPNRTLSPFKKESILRKKFNKPKDIRNDSRITEQENVIMRPPRNHHQTSSKLAEGNNLLVGRMTNGNAELDRSSVADRLKLFETKTPEEVQRGNGATRVTYTGGSMSPMIKNTNLDVHRATFAVTKTDSLPRVNKFSNVGKPLPPKKPPRTFAHDIYVESKNNKNPLKPDSLYRRKYCELYSASQSKVKTNENTQTQVFVDLTSFNLGPSKQYGTLKRSFSEEHIYASPYELHYSPNKTAEQIYAQPFSTPEKSERSRTIGNKELHYMSTPIVDSNQSAGKTSKPTRDGNFSTPNARRKASTTSNIREMVNQSFNELWKRLYTKVVDDGIDQTNSDLGDSGSEVSIKDVQDRIIYVKSLRKKVVGTVANESQNKTPKLFDCLLVSCLTPARKDSSPKPRLVYKYPEKEGTVYERKMIPQLCFSDCTTIKSTTMYKSETFFFAVQDGNGTQTFGFCLRLLGSPQVHSQTAFLTLPTVVCLLTNRNAVGLYTKILLEIEKHLFLSQSDFEDYVMRLYDTEAPSPGRAFWLPDKSEPNKISMTQVQRPTDNRIVNTEVTHLLQFLEVDLLLKVIASMLLERRILLVADSSGTLIKCVTAILSLLYPLGWRHAVIPSLPDSLLSQACSSSPYLFGVSSHTFHKIVDIQRDKILIVDLDQGFALREVGDEHTILPSRSLKAVKVALSLAKNMTDPTEMLRDVMISEAFLRMFVETIGHCDKFITEINRGNFVFQKDGFCRHPSSKSVQMFLTWFCETEMFEAFVDERINRKKTCSIRKQPILSVPDGLFDRRLEEYLKQCHGGSSGIKDNVREIGKKVKIFGERLKGLKAF